MISAFQITIIILSAIVIISLIVIIATLPMQNNLSNVTTTPEITQTTSPRTTSPQTTSPQTTSPQTTSSQTTQLTTPRITSPQTTQLTTPQVTQTSTPFDNSGTKVYYNQPKDSSAQFSNKSSNTSTNTFIFSTAGLTGTLKSITFFSIFNSNSSGDLPTYNLNIGQNYNTGDEFIVTSNGTFWISFTKNVNIRVNYNDIISITVTGKEFSLSSTRYTLNILPDQPSANIKLNTGIYTTTINEETKTYNLGTSGVDGFLSDITIQYKFTTLYPDSPYKLTAQINSYNSTIDLKISSTVSFFPNIPIKASDLINIIIIGKGLTLESTFTQLTVIPNQPYITTTPLGGEVLELNFFNGTQSNIINILSNKSKNIFPSPIYIYSFTSSECTDWPAKIDFNLGFRPTKISINKNNTKYSISAITFFGSSQKCQENQIEIPLDTNIDNNYFINNVGMSGQKINPPTRGMLIMLQ